MSEIFKPNFSVPAISLTLSASQVLSAALPSAGYYLVSQYGFGDSVLVGSNSQSFDFTKGIKLVNGTRDIMYLDNSFISVSATDYVVVNINYGSVV